VLAFADAPFVVVQPALASGLLILLFIGSRLFGEHVDWVEIVGVSAIIVGSRLSPGERRRTPRLTEVARHSSQSRWG